MTEHYYDSAGLWLDPGWRHKNLWFPADRIGLHGPTAMFVALSYYYSATSHQTKAQGRVFSTENAVAGAE